MITARAAVPAVVREVGTAVVVTRGDGAAHAVAIHTVAVTLPSAGTAMRRVGPDVDADLRVDVTIPARLQPRSAVWCLARVQGFVGDGG